MKLLRKIWKANGKAITEAEAGAEVEAEVQKKKWEPNITELIFANIASPMGMMKCRVIKCAENVSALEKLYHYGNVRNIGVIFTKKRASYVVVADIILVPAITDHR